MPGIVGMISRRPPSDCEDLVRSMVASMQHERSYASGTYSVPGLGVYAGWVAHENSFAAKQPFSNEQRNIALIFSGECFADQETLAAVRRKGHAIRNNNDWLVHLYEEESEQFFEKLNGVFSGVLIDHLRRTVFLFNDRYGMERIYWHNKDDGFYFASEAKALLKVLPELREFDPEGVAEYLTFGCTLKTRTLFRDVHVLPAGSVWSLSEGIWRRQKYFSPEAWESQSQLSPQHFEREFEETFQAILPRYFQGEAKVGISLTAGLDCRMIMACRPQIPHRPICYTFSGPNRDTLDARIAARVAMACGLDHQVLRIGEDFFSDFRSHADQTVYVTDGTLGPLGAHEIYLNRQAGALAPVRLTGVFGGEILRGVSFLKPLGLCPQLLHPDFAGLLQSAKCRAKRENAHPVTVAAFGDIPEKRFGPPAAGRSQVVFRTPYLDNQIVALSYRLPEAQRESSKGALRLIKAKDPLLADILTDRGLGGQNATLTSRLRRAMCETTFKLDYYYNEGLPNRLSVLDPLLRVFHSRVGLLGHHKFLHYRSWFRRELASYLRETISHMQNRSMAMWNTDFLGHLATEHIRGRRNFVTEIGAVLTLEAVERLLFREPSRDAKCRPETISARCHPAHATSTANNLRK